MHLRPDIALAHLQLVRRDDDKDASKNRTLFLSVSAGVVILLALVLLFYSFLGRKIGTYSPKNRWRVWNRNKSYGQVASHDRSQSLVSVPTSYNRQSVDDRTSNERNPTQTPSASRVDRNASVRSTSSVMTLPAYSAAPKTHEQIIGREGERAGMDTVVEFPETQQDTEARREDEMESLYQIRLQRRREVQEQQQRRQDRRDARMAGDQERLEQLRTESILRAEIDNSGSNTELSARAMLAEHQSRGRERRVSSVSYADVGHVRHDGSRVRANSQESERGGLLDGAAPMGEGRNHNRTGSAASSMFSVIPRPHTRDRSVSSLRSVSTNASDTDIPPQLTPSSLNEAGRTSASSHRRSPLSATFSVGADTTSSSPTNHRFTPQDSSGSDDIGDSHIPPPIDPPVPTVQPPLYSEQGFEDAPAYQSPTDDRRQILNARLYGVRAGPGAGPGLEAGVAAGSSSNTRTSAGTELPRRIPSKAPKLPMIDTLPSINVESATEPNTPASPVRR